MIDENQRENKVLQWVDLRALSQGLSQPLFSVTLALLPTLHRHVESTKMVLEFKVNSSLCGGKIDLLDVLLAWDLVDFGNVLKCF